MMLLEDYPKNNPDVYVAWLGENTIEQAMNITENLRKNNLKVHIDFSSKGMKAHMKKADRLSVRYCVIIGEDELNKGVVLIKDFLTREQKEIAFENIIKEIKGE